MAIIAINSTTATISFEAPLADWTRIVNAMSVRFGYSATLPDKSANPQTAAQFVVARILQWATSETMAHELGTAKAAVTVSSVTLS